MAHEGVVKEIRSEFVDRNVNVRAEIDTSPPFGSVKEAVTRFGGSGPWIPHYKLHGAGEFDIKKVQDQAAALEKDLIMKELETLDILEELGTTKRVVEELKQQLQNEAFRSISVPDVNSEDRMLTPVIKEVNVESCRNIIDGCQQVVGRSSPCPMSSPDMILMELKEAKLNLGRTMNELGVIQTSVESLNKKMKKERIFLENTRERLTPKFAGVSPLEERKEINVETKGADDAYVNSDIDISTTVANKLSPLNLKTVDLRKIAEVEKAEVSRNVKTAEMRLIAARKMEEAAKATEAVALAEIKALSNNETMSWFPLSEPERKSVPSAEDPRLAYKSQVPDLPTNKNRPEVMFQFDDANICRLAMLKLEAATEEIKYSRRALEEALNRVDTANKKQLAAEEALRRWTPERNQNTHSVNTATNFYGLHPYTNNHDFLALDVNRTDLVDSPKPVLRSTISMRDVLSKKQTLQDESTVRKNTEGQTTRSTVALSQLLQELKQDTKFPAKAESYATDQKQLLTQRKKFGFIHISLPMPKQSKKKTHAL